MPLVDAKCTNCGATLTVDNQKEAAVCQFCGSAFIVEKAINNYINTVNISTSNVINSENTVFVDSEKQRSEEKIAFDVENGIKNEYYKEAFYQEGIQREISDYLHSFPAGEFGYQHYVTWVLNCFPYFKTTEIPEQVKRLKKYMADYKNVKGAKCYDELCVSVQNTMKQMEISLQEKLEEGEKALQEKKNTHEMAAENLNASISDYDLKIKEEEKTCNQLALEKEKLEDKVTLYRSRNYRHSILFYIICAGIFLILLVYIIVRKVVYNENEYVDAGILAGIVIIYLLLIIRKLVVRHKYKLFQNLYAAKSSEYDDSCKKLSEYKEEKARFTAELSSADENIKEATSEFAELFAELGTVLAAVREY